MSDTFIAFVDDLTEIVRERRELREENTKLKAELQTLKQTFGKSSGSVWTGPRRLNRRKLEQHEVRQILDYRANGVRVTELARMYDVAHSTISRIISGVYHKDAA